MRHKKKKQHIWSDALCDVLLHSIPKNRFGELLPEVAAEKKLQGKKSAEPQERIANLAWRSRRVQRELMRLWRQENADVVSAADVVSLDGPTEQSEALLSQFGAETILLELITDELEDGWELARSIVKLVGSPTVRAELKSILNEWSKRVPRRTPPKNLRKKRITIFGGRMRDESIYMEHVDSYLFDVRWMVCERNHGSADHRILNRALKHTDAAIVVVAMVSHATMWRVKRYSQVHGVPWTPMKKLTIRQLKKAISELFPITDQRHSSKIAKKRNFDKEKPL